jgi:ABC-type multidrug transport system fused ATPase/permease subunit
VLFATSVAENIGHGKPQASMDEIVRAAEGAGIDSIIARLPEGYDTVIGERGGTLSGGQRQCVAIARAMIRDPGIVILDEPMVGLDAQSAALVMQALERLMQGRTVIIISHQLASARDADRVVVLDVGRIVEQGNHESLLSAGGIYRALHLHQSGGHS